MPKLLLLDGNSLTYRAFFALPTDMATASGQVTNAVFGFTSMMINLLRDQQPDGVLVAFDRPEPTFRHEAHPEYKANRSEAPDILRQQMGLVRQVVETLGISMADTPGFEADDIIATLVAKAKERGDEVVIVTGDRDSYQLVEDPLVKVLYNRRGVSDYVLYDEAGIEERTGVTPGQYREYAALRGDPSDNLPGVPGVGEKTAARLIVKYGGLDGVFAHPDEETPKLRASLAEHEGRVRANADLMRLRLDAPAEVDLDRLQWGPKDPAELKRLFDFLEFRSLFERLEEVLAAPIGVDPPSGEVLEPELTRSETAAESAAALHRPAVLDVAARYEGAEGRTPLVGLAVVVEPETGGVVWVPAAHLADPAVQAALSDGRRLRAHNAKALLRGFEGHGLDLHGLELDTIIAAYLLDPAEARYAIGELLLRYTGHSMPEGATPEGQLDLGGDGVDVAVEAAREALAVSRLAPALENALDKQGMRRLYDEIENPLVRVLARMEAVGVGVDRAELQALHDRLTADCRRLAGDVYAAAGREFNLNSPPQLRA